MVIEMLAKNRRVALKPNEPALICSEGVIQQPFHYWRGRTGRRYLHSVYSLLDCPELPHANYILVRRDADGMRTPLSVGQTLDDATSLNLARLRQLGARMGANEVHIHVLAEDPEERDDVEADLCAGQLTTPAHDFGYAIAAAC